MATMYCPQCATPNTEQARFCRSCGMELEGVALALKGQSSQPIELRGRDTQLETANEWLDRRGKAIKSISTGISLLVVSVLIAVAMAFFVPPNIPWMLAWAVLVGWMAMWGGVEVGNGIAGLVEAKSRLRLLGFSGRQPANDARTRVLSPADQSSRIEDGSAVSKSSAPSSVTEGTTRHLDGSVKK